MTEEEKDNRKVLERLIMFTDAVYAIALTLLVLELRLPEGVAASDPRDMLHHLGEMTPRFMAFLLSAVVVGGNWIATVSIQQTLVRVNNALKISVLVYLIVISLMPFCCNMIGSYPDNPVSYVVFGVIGELMMINGFFFLRNNRKKNLYNADADMTEISKLEKSIPIAALFVAGMAATAFYSTRLSFALFLIYNLIPIFVSRLLMIKHKV